MRREDGRAASTCRSDCCPLASVVGAFGVVAAAVLRPGAAPPPAAAAAHRHPQPGRRRLQPPLPPLPQHVRARRLVRRPGPARGVPALAARGSRSGRATRSTRSATARSACSRRAGGSRARGRSPEKASCLGVASDGRVAVGSPGRVDLYGATGDHIGGFAAARADKPAEVTAVRLVRDAVLVADAAARVIRRYDLQRNRTGRDRRAEQDRRLHAAEPEPRFRRRCRRRGPRRRHRAPPGDRRGRSTGRWWRRSASSAWRGPRTSSAAATR